MHFINKTSKCNYNDSISSNSWKILQNKWRSSQNIIDIMHEDWSDSNTYSPPIHPFQNHILNPILNQEVDGYLGDGSVATMSWSKNGGKK